MDGIISLACESRTNFLLYITTINKNLSNMKLTNLHIFASLALI